MPPNLFSFLRVAHDAQMDLCQRARELRLQKNITQAALAKAIGISEGTLKRFEKEGEIQLSAFLRLADYFGRLSEIDHLLTPSELPESLFDYKEPHQRQRARGKK